LDTGSQFQVLKSSDEDSGHYTTREPFSPSDRLDGVLKRGKKQLDETPSEPEAFKLLWLFVGGANADMTIRRALFTFYGIATLSPLSKGGGGVNCVYFHSSTSYAMPGVNGLIVMENDSLQLCLNEFSPNYSSFQMSNLVRDMGDAIYDPSRFESEPGTIVLRSNVPRKNEQDVLDELERTTGVRYVKTQLHRYIF